jgi:hypothetical protein
VAETARFAGSLEDLANAKPNTDVVSKALDGVAPGQFSDKISERIGTLTKGRSGGYSEDHAQAADFMFRKAITKGRSNPAEVIKGLSPQFNSALSMAAQTPQNSAMADLVQQLNTVLGAEIGKNITLTSPLSSGLVPYDLVAPAKLIYPVYSPFRNKIPRTQGQGTQHLAKIVTAIQGSAAGGLGQSGNRMSISELNGGTLNQSYPINLPASGSQSVSDISIPYKFFGLTESVSWLAQFAGQGFDDAAGLAALILLQESMILEEKAILSATSVALSTPNAAVLAAARSAGTGETGLSGVTTNVYVVVTALNYYGETVGSSVASVAASNGQVIDVTLPGNSSGALAYNVYVGTGTTAPARTAQWLKYGAVGAAKITLQGAIPTSGQNPPASDTGTSSTNDYEGLISAISGHSAGTVYPSGFQGSYVNQSVGDVLSTNALNNALEGMWNGPSGVFANPDELWAEGGDLARLAQSMANAATGTAGYRFEVNQTDVANLRGGAAVSEYVNPITRKVIGLNVHPYIPQGTAIPISWTLPQPIQNVSNVWENVMVQDYLSISWPVVDVTFRQSLFFYGTLFSPAVQFNGLLQGIQKSTAANGGTYA